MILLKDDESIAPQASRKSKRERADEGDSVAMWLEQGDVEKISEAQAKLMDNSEFVECGDAYDEYHEWCTEKSGFRFPVNIVKFGRRLKRAGVIFRDGRKTTIYALKLTMAPPF